MKLLCLFLTLLIFAQAQAEDLSAVLELYNFAQTKEHLEQMFALINNPANRTQFHAFLAGVHYRPAKLQARSGELDLNFRGEITRIRIVDRVHGIYRINDSEVDMNPRRPIGDRIEALRFAVSRRSVRIRSVVMPEAFADDDFNSPDADSIANVIAKVVAGVTGDLLLQFDKEMAIMVKDMRDLNARSCNHKDQCINGDGADPGCTYEVSPRCIEVQADCENLKKLAKVRGFAKMNSSKFCTELETLSECMRSKCGPGRTLALDEFTVMYQKEILGNLLTVHAIDDGYLEGSTTLHPLTK